MASHPAATSNPAAMIVGAVVLLSVLACMAAVYLLPTIIAMARKHPLAARIALLNILAGWTVIGWFAALAGSLRKPALPLSTAPAAAIPPEPIGADVTFSALLESDFVEKVLVVQAGGYRKRWLALAQKAGVLDKRISNPEARKAIAWRRSWNPVGGVAVLGWMGYRKARYWWAATILGFTALMFSDLLQKELRDVVLQLGFVASVLVLALFSDSWLLSTIVRERALFPAKPVAHRSVLNVWLSLALFVAIGELADLAAPTLSPIVGKLSSTATLFISLAAIPVALAMCLVLVREGGKATSNKALKRTMYFALAASAVVAIPVLLFGLYVAGELLIRGSLHHPLVRPH